ncbi:Cadherin-7, partial [Oryzias melastigma]
MGRRCSGVRGALALVALLFVAQSRSCWGLNSRSGDPEKSPQSDPDPWEVQQRHKRSWVWNQFFVLEEYTGNEPLYVGKLHSDVDKGDGKVKYVLSGEGATSIFTIDENTGDIHATKRLDREAQAYYTLQAQAVDRFTNLPVEPKSEFVVKVQDINDNEPKFVDGPYLAGVPEMSPLGTMVVQVEATDADDPTYGNSARVVYSIVHGQPYFSVEPKTGSQVQSVVVKQRWAAERSLLAESQQQDLAAHSDVCVRVCTDKLINLPVSYRRRSSLGLDCVLLDAQQKLENIFVKNDVFLLYSHPSFIVGVTVFWIFLFQPLDFETRSSFALRIEATNRNIDSNFLSLGPFSDTTSVKVTVEDVNEPPIFSTTLSQMVVSEDARTGTSIGRVSAHDPDTSNSAIRYSIDRNTDLERFFNVDALSGVISTAKPLDREANSVHNLTIFAIESQDPMQIGKGVALVTVLDINDNAPVFAMDYETLLCENALAGQ